eukprot:CAMPEP_0182423510 /NCGR_PEP_ID=MMETSP1167-20130531/9540_1 /TAXON_ID=2988 /ORGANISM="Mallomonas Sp, Strain CCMP3275" /LENGTH=481 /DNA_ID=CAMNT_0024602569 /DNA_START=39 /DNA_END=1484 /DNA_ORIENTATION=-
MENSLEPPCYTIDQSETLHVPSCETSDIQEVASVENADKEPVVLETQESEALQESKESDLPSSSEMVMDVAEIISEAANNLGVDNVEEGVDAIVKALMTDLVNIVSNFVTLLDVPTSEGDLKAQGVSFDSNQSLIYGLYNSSNFPQSNLGVNAGAKENEKSVDKSKKKEKSTKPRVRRMKYCPSEDVAPHVEWREGGIVVNPGEDVSNARKRKSGGGKKYLKKPRPSFEDIPTELTHYVEVKQFLIGKFSRGRTLRRGELTGGHTIHLKCNCEDFNLIADNRNLAKQWKVKAATNIEHGNTNKETGEFTPCTSEDPSVGFKITSSKLCKDLIFLQAMEEQRRKDTPRLSTETLVNRFKQHGLAVTKDIVKKACFLFRKKEKALLETKKAETGIDNLQMIPTTGAIIQPLISSNVPFISVTEATPISAPAPTSTPNPLFGTASAELADPLPEPKLEPVPVVQEEEGESGLAGALGEMEMVHV